MQALFACSLLLTTGLAWAGYPTPNKPGTIGNAVFQDYNHNGNLDTGEPGFANIPVQLYQSGIKRGQTLTDANGQFTFTNTNVPAGIQPNTTYEIRIVAADFPAGFTLTKQATSSVGNNAQFTGNNAVVTLTTDGSGNPASLYGIGFAAGYPDLVITTSATSSTAAKGSNVTFTIQVNNTGSGAATSVIASTTLDAGLSYVSSSPTATTVTSGTATVLMWNLNTITAGAPTTTLSVVATAQTEGVLYNTASVSTVDTDNNPSNNISRGCVSVPIKLCPSDKYVASLPSDYTNVQWFRNGSSTPIASGNSFTIVQSGSYSFTTTANTSCPANGCCPIIVEDGIVPNLAITPTNPAICAGTSTTLTASGCTGGTLLWNTSATSASIFVSPAVTTIYSVTCNSTTYGTCTASISTTVTVNPSVTATLSSATICNGTTASLTATGGTNYVFSTGASNTTGLLTVSPSATTLYSVTVTNGQGCSAVATGTVTVNPSVTATLSSATICNGTTASLTATGGTTYLFSTGTSNTTGLLSVSPSATTLYSVTVTNGQGCSAVATGTVTVNPSVTATLSSATICNGTTASLTATGGTNYVFSTGASNTTGLLTVSPSATTLYSVTVTNGQGCSAVATGTVTVNPSVTATLSSATICNGTTASLTATGGTTYLFSTGTSNTTGLLSVSPSATTLYSVTVTNGQGCSAVATGTVTVNPSVTATLSSATICNGTTASLTATGGTNYLFSTGTSNTTGLLSVAPSATTLYSVTVTNGQGCSAVATGTVTVNPSVTATLSSATICNGTTASLTATGGTNYLFSTGTSNTTGLLTVSPSATTLYSVTVTNGQGCSAVATGTVTVNPSVTATLSSATICNGTTASLTATGGTNYLFSTGTSNTTGLLSVSPSATTLYSVTVTNGQGCSAVATGTVTVNPSVTATLSSATICNGTTASLTATGGTNYLFSTGTSNTTGLLSVSPSATTLYSVTVTNGQGCSAVATGTVTVNPSVTATLSSATICNGTTASLTATGGTNYLFSTGTSNTTGLLTVSPSATTLYSVTVTNGQGCSAIATATVTVNPSVTVTLTVSSGTVCQGTSATLTANGGTSFLWSTGASTPTISVTAGGPYSVTVSNAQGCFGVASTTITVNPTPVLTLNSPTVCAGQSVVLTVGGCSGTLTWATGDQTTSLTVTPLATTVYSATCVLSSGCSSTVSTTVRVNDAPSYSTNGGGVLAVPATCNGATPNNNAHIDLTGLVNVEQAGLSTGSTYTGPAYSAGTQSVSGSTFSFNGLPNPNSKQLYTVRLFSPSGTCFTDVTVTLDPVVCQCPAPVCVPIVIKKVVVVR